MDEPHVTEKIIENMIAFAREHWGVEYSREDAREAATNLLGVCSLLLKWDAEDRARAAAVGYSSRVSLPIPGLRLGTSSWSSPDWVGPFYPPGTAPERFIEHYVTVYDTVEVDATYYRMPTRANVEAWRSRTPEGFTFALKTPGLITHEKALVDVGDDMARFLDVITGLGSRLGAVLLQFPYFNKQAWMPTVAEWPRLTGGPTADFAYVRFLGDRKKIEELTKTWEKTVIDRSAVIADWVPVVRGTVDNGVYVHAYFNNHFAGHAPESLELFKRLWREGRAPR
ncbi:MAG: DUF72 domain-containing protein [Proteobacteria bacterium]|nr:DUF72 domain-containing protein [Pseudomonadota bacterium]